MKRVDISISAVVGILLGVISLWAFFVNGFEIISYHPSDFAYLSEQDFKVDQYVEGTITECVTVSVRQNGLVGSSELIGMDGRTYETYTVPINGDQYIRVRIYEEETLKGMESIVHGDAAEVSFAGQIKKADEPLNNAWYDWNPKFDQSKIVTDYVIWQKTLDREKNLCLAGFLGIVIAILIYYSRGGIKIKEVEPETIIRRGGVYNYNKETELEIAREHLKMYEERERKYHDKKIRGILYTAMGLFFVITIKVFELKFIGVIPLIFGIKEWWRYFINSKNRFAVKIARIFSIETLQDKKTVEERKIEAMEQEVKQ